MYHLSNIASYNYKFSSRTPQYDVIACMIFFLILIICCPQTIYSQDIPIKNENNTNNTTSELNKKRLHWTFVLGGTMYAGSSYLLYDNWYKNYSSSSFHTKNDLPGWRGMDKFGHIFSSYFQSNWAYQAWRWAGVNEKKAIYSGVAVGFLAQTTIEVLDGFSENWGFSWSDMGANTVGLGLFAFQQAHWGEQRILLKTSYTPINYTDKYGSPVVVSRANELFGLGFGSRFLKDYNAQTTWISFNPRALFEARAFPKWLNIALGYGVENLFGARTNQFNDASLNVVYPRYSQFFISLDADLSRIDTPSPFLRTVLDLLNILKMPFSTVEINTLGQVKMHLIRF